MAVQTGVVNAFKYARDELVTQLEMEMYEAAERLEFERAANLRDRVNELKAMPDYGDQRKVSMSQVEAPKPKPGQPRSKAGITARGKRRRS